MSKHAGEGKPVLLSDRRVAERYDVVVRTLERWDLQPDLGFPPPVRINRRRYREVAALEAWERETAKRAVETARSHLSPVPPLPVTDPGEVYPLARQDEDESR